MPDGYDKDRNGFDNNSRGRIFENGTYIHFRDRENGYVQGSRTINTEKGKIQFDKFKDERNIVSSIEDKSGEIRGPKDEKQLKAARALLEKDPNHRHMLRSVEGEKISVPAQELIDGLVRDFPDRFTHLVIDRETAREIWAKGLQKEVSKELGQQLELDKVREKAREGKAQALENRRDKIAALARAREAREKFRAVEAFRESAARGKAEAPQRIQAERARQAELRADRAKAREAPETERERVSREAAEKTVREFQERLKIGPVPSAGKTPEKTTPERGSPEAAKAALVEQVERDAARLAAREFPFPVPDRPQERETVEIGERSTSELNQAASVEREAADKARAERESADKAREAAQERAKALEQAQLQGISPEVKNLLALGQAHPPTAAVETKPGYAPGVERGGTGQGRDPRTPEIGPRTQ
ncbi:hypothetical protein [Nocardia brasiliensis]|uniref:hypothetical protein n=1 Tax=Nocardia brasiliensis TaxID=37326 RepID=UPI003670378A